MTFRTRFAPSPTGPLHLGHAFSAITAYRMAQKQGGAFLLRIENIDSQRSRQGWENLIYEDLAWLGLTWEQPVLRQSEREDAYQNALSRLDSFGLLYPCTCTRADIETAVSAPQEGVSPFGPDSRMYPGTCRKRRMTDAQSGDALRLDMAKAVALLDSDLSYFEHRGLIEGHHFIHPTQLINQVGDVVLKRRQSGDVAYHLAVVLDDDAQGITHVVRGADLEDATKIHVLLQHLLAIQTPDYVHHRLIRDAAGKRLAKRTDAKSIKTYRDQGVQPKDIYIRLGL